MSDERKVLDSRYFNVSASEEWQKTGIMVTKDEKITVKQISGSWTINPSQGFCDANGLAIKAKLGYTLQGQREGALIGRVGQRVFLLGGMGETPEGVEGELELCANDDIEERYGLGFRDNNGTIEFEIKLWLR